MKGVPKWWDDIEPYACFLKYSTSYYPVKFIWHSFSFHLHIDYNQLFTTIFNLPTSSNTFMLQAANLSTTNFLFPIPLPSENDTYKAIVLIPFSTSNMIFPDLRLSSYVVHDKITIHPLPTSSNLSLITVSLPSTLTLEKISFLFLSIFLNKHP